MSTAAANKIHAGELPLGDIFGARYEFNIPDYQRPYAWGEEQAVQLLDDIADSMGRGEEEPYFLGSLVLVKDDADPRTDVIDGQQRLTTLTILLAVLRDLAEDIRVAQGIGAYLVEEGDVIRRIPSNPRLNLRHRDRGFFGDFVQTPGKISELIALGPDDIKTDSQEAIRDNAKALHSRLAEWTDGDRLELANQLMNRTFLVLVSTADLGSAHRVFGVMNARGLDLSPADIFKSKVIGALPDTVASQYADKWEEAEVLLGRDDFADLFLHIRTIFSRTRGRRELLIEFPEQVLNGYTENGRAAEFVDDVLVPYADAYRIVRDRAYSAAQGAEPINRWFTRLAQIDNKDWLPSALWAIRHHRTATDPTSWLEAFLVRLERLAASMLIRRVYTTPRVVTYIDLLKELADGAGLDAASFNLDDEAKTSTVRALNGPLYESKRVVKYVLLRLDETIAGNDAGASYTHRVISVEHVLPQNPPADSSWRETFTDDERALWTHRIANLVLLNRVKNSEASNREFEIKRDRYFRSKNGVAVFPLTVQVLNATEWTPSVLEQRQSEHLDALTKLWKLE